MNIHLDIAPDAEEAIRAQAKASGVTLTQYIGQIVTRQARSGSTVAKGATGQILVDASTRIRGILTDAEVDYFFGANPSNVHR